MKKIDLCGELKPNKEVAGFPEIDLQYSISKDQVWKNLLHQIEETPSLNRNVFLRNPIYRFALAASLLLCLSVTGLMRYYTTTVYNPAGQHLTFYLPDSSLIELNAQSQVSYHPYWFRFSRTVSLAGEAYFKVVSGNSFKVISKLGETIVLGTSFNIYSRNNNYRVTCFTGKVRVVSAEKQERLLLNPDEQAFINKDGFLRFVQEVNNQAVKAWRDNMFVFTGSSVTDVLEEIERQYDIKIVFNADSGLTYTGNFSKTLTGKEVLDLVCTPLGLKFVAKSDAEFLIE